VEERLVNLHELTRDELRLLFARWGLATVHADTVWNRLYLGLAAAISPREMPGLPPRILNRLAAGARLTSPGVALATDSSDGFTRKYLLALEDDRRIETVLMRYSGRVTACVSSQAGCAMGCVFCATGQMGFTRHLTAGEIVAQAVHVARALRAAPSESVGSSAGAPELRHVLSDKLGERVFLRAEAEETAREATAAPEPRLRNIVLMGMGEPLHNYDAVVRAVDILRDPAGLALGAERITLSTVGVVPGILRLARERRPLHLAVSLHAATQEGRAALIPGARRWPLDELMAACRTYGESTGRRIFYEWTLIAGRNDSPDEARRLGRLLQGLPAQVNLIPLNPTGGYEGEPSRADPVRRFQGVLREEFGLPCTVRQRRGIDIAAGCGQLAVNAA
jgi:23S rRNA (adenine2503-C2)-methyltransferase